MRIRLILILAALLLEASAAPASAQRLDGFNLVAVPGHPFGGVSARQAMAAAKDAGAKAVAIVPFVWQPDPSSAQLVRGDDMPDDEVRAAIRDAKALGLAVLVKPHVWVPERWAGAVRPATEPDWATWFQNYQSAMRQLARLAADEHADIFVVGTELAQTSARPEWRTLIAAVREDFPGKLTYVAHNIEEAGRVPFWGDLDLIGVSLYPPLGEDSDRSGRRATMATVAERLGALSQGAGKLIMVAEIGLRSAQGAAAKPWESAEERAAIPDPALQAEVLADWLSALARPSIAGVMIWRWLTDPAAGGTSDTDFTVQNKPAEAMLRCAWAAVCAPP